MSQCPRLDKLQSKLGEIDCDAFLVTDETNVRYLTGFTGDSTSVFVERSEVSILSDGRYVTQLRDECPGIRAVIRSPRTPMHQLVLDVIGSSDVKRLGIEASSMSLATFLQIEKRFSESGMTIDFVKTAGVVEAQREVKEDAEIDCIRRSIEIAERAFEQAIVNLNPAQTETEFARDLEWAMRESGAEGVSFDIIAAFGEAGALPHYRPSQRPLGDQSTILIDWGAKVNGYASDLTRTLHRVGPKQGRASLERFQGCYEAVLESQIAAINALQPGVTGRQIDTVARDVLASHGLADAFLHSLGHGIGLQIHEGPRLAGVGEKPLQAGMVVTVEPGVYFEGDFGIRIEDDVLITPNGAEVLSSLPKGLDDCRLML